MEEKNKGINLGRYWPLWGLHFGFHIIIGLLASLAGLVVIFLIGQVLNGLALVGAGSFALINGWQGCKALAEYKVHNRPITSKGNNR